MCKLRVLHCIPTLGMGGAERQIRQLLPELIRLGCECALVARMSDKDVARMARANVSCFPLHAAGNYSLRDLTAVLLAVRHWRPSIVQTWLVKMDILGGGLSMLLGIPFVVSERASLEGYPPSIKMRVRHWIGMRSKMVIANSPAGLDVWPSHPVRQVIANGLDLTAIHGVLAATDTRLGQCAGRSLIIAAGRLAFQKNMEVLIEAMQIVRMKRPDALLAILGDGELRPQLQAQISAAGLGDHVVLQGALPDVWSWFRRARVFVSASRFEGQPNVVLEAAVCRVPMVLSDIREHRDAIGNDGAIYVRPDDPMSYASAVLSLLDDEGVCRRITAAAAERCGALDVRACAMAYRIAYETIINRSGIIS